MPVCKDCGAPVRWVRTENGRAMPLDAKSRLDGNVILVRGLAHVLSKVDRIAESTPRWTAHFATCPMKRPRRST